MCNSGVTQGCNCCAVCENYRKISLTPLRPGSGQDRGGQGCGGAEARHPAAQEARGSRGAGQAAPRGQGQGGRGDQAQDRARLAEQRLQRVRQRPHLRPQVGTALLLPSHPQF